VNAVQPMGIESPHIRTLASAKGVTSEIVSLALRGLKFSGGSDRDAAAAQSEGVSSSAAASTKPTSGTLQASLDKTAGGGGQTQQGKGGDKDVENMLPIEAFREDILARVSVEGVTTINGETGCGKSSMVPKFLLDRALEKGVKANIIVCQPRRIAAVSLAKRVAGLYGEDMGGKVGYRVGHGERCVSSKTKITYVTVGWLLQHLSFNPEKLSR
jgi:HrpA-like RNA helicase